MLLIKIITLSSVFNLYLGGFDHHNDETDSVKVAIVVAVDPSRLGPKLDQLDSPGESHWI